MYAPLSLGVMSVIVGRYKYSLMLWFFLLMLHNFPFVVHLSHSIIWNRFVNNQGKPDTNLPLDLDLEHENKYFQQNIKYYRGVLIQQAIDKVSKASNITKYIVCNLAKETGHFTAPTSRVGVELLINKLSPCKLLMSHPGRHYKNIHVPFTGLKVNGTATLKWVWCAQRVLNSKHYYRHARNVK